MKIARFEQPEETAAEFYARRAKESAESASRLYGMYTARKIHGTALTDAIWDGYQALKEQAETFALKSEKSKVPQ